MTGDLDELTCSPSDLPNIFCFICGKSISDKGVNIVGAETSCLGTPLADILAKIIGDKYLIVLAKEDKICYFCLNLMNRLDKLEQELWITKQKVGTLLECKYKIRLENLVSSPYNSLNIIHDEVKECCNISSSIKSQNDILKCKIENVHPSNVSLDEVVTHKDIERDVVALEVDFVAKSSDSSNLVAELSDETAKTNISELVAQEIVEQESVFFYSTEYIHPSSLENTLSSNCSEAIGKYAADIPYYVLDQDKQIENEKGKETGHLLIKDKMYLCEICDIPFPKSYLLLRHKKIHQKSRKKVTCPICNTECHDHLHYIYHRKNKHDLLNRLTCTLCEKKFSSNKDLKNHLLTAHQGEEFQCSLCEERFKRHDQFANHKLYAHGKRKCRICGKHIPNIVKLRQHENRHVWIESKNLICDVCGRSFKTPGGLKMHKVSHTGNYKFFCEFCGRGFMSSVVLEEHKGVHTREERYICDICGSKFVLYSTFHLHKQWHRDPFPFPCKICKKKFKFRSVRAIHMRRDHTGESLYKCHQCSAEFLKAVSLKKHIITHTKEFPYNCNVCLKGFIQRRNLARHMVRIHNDNSFKKVPKICQFKVVLQPDQVASSLEIS